MKKKAQKKALSKFMGKLKTGFINKVTGKELNDPTPMTIIPKHSTIDRIQKILNHNLAIHAQNNGLDTPEDLDDFTVNDMYSERFEESLYQIVDNIQANGS